MPEILHAGCEVLGLLTSARTIERNPKDKPLQIENPAEKTMGQKHGGEE